MREYRLGNRLWLTRDSPKSGTLGKKDDADCQTSVPKFFIRIHLRAPWGTFPYVVPPPVSHPFPSISLNNLSLPITPPLCSLAGAALRSVKCRGYWGAVARRNEGVRVCS